MIDRCWELYKAADAGNEARVSELLAVDGINVNYKASFDYGFSPLHVAAQYGHPNIIHLLHQAGAELEIRTDAGSTPLNIAGLYGRRNCVALLLLLGANMDSPDDIKETPLHQAARRGEKDIVTLLIESGANTEAKNNKGKTPRDVADNEEIKCGKADRLT